jgi:hypothetical protein
MKNNILALAFFSFIFFSCDNTSGNKDIIPVDSFAQTEKIQGVNPHEAHTAIPSDSVKEESAAAGNENTIVPTDSTKIKKQETEKDQ